MSKHKAFGTHCSADIRQLYEVMCSREYLLTSESARGEVVASRYEPGEAGGVDACLSMRSFVSDEDGRQRELVIEQSTAITPMDVDGFGMSTCTALPFGMGTMVTQMHMVPDSAGQGTAVDVVIRVDTALPLLGAKLARHLLANSEETIGKGLRRAEEMIASDRAGGA